MTGEAGRSARVEAARLRATAGLPVRTRAARALAAAAAGGFLGFLLHPVVGLILAATGGITGAVLTNSRTSDRSSAAGRWEAGAVGEEATALLLAPLQRRGWTVLHDRAIPGSRANLDHLLIGPQGQVVVVDSKRWSARDGALVHLRAGQLWCGQYDRARQVDTLLWETRTVAAAIRAPAVAVMVVHGAPVTGGALYVDGVTVTGPASLRTAVTAARGAGNAATLARTAATRFPAYSKEQS